MAFVGPGLLPGRTLSNSDSLWFEPPWVGVKAAELERPSNPELGDAPRHIQLFLRQVADDFPDVPLWNPAIMAGRPLHANAQSAAFGPFSLPTYVLPFWTALGWIAVLKLWVAAFGAYLLGRCLGMRFAGALMAGLVFAFSLKMATWLSYPHAGVWALIPWLLAATDRVVRRPDLPGAAGLAAVAGLQFLCGHPESSFHALLAAVAFLALRLWQARPGLPARRCWASPAGWPAGRRSPPSRSCPSASSSGCRPTCASARASRWTCTCRSRTSSACS